jgi:hypothetical protein
MLNYQRVPFGDGSGTKTNGDGMVMVYGLSLFFSHWKTMWAKEW